MFLARRNYDVSIGFFFNFLSCFCFVNVSGILGKFLAYAASNISPFCLCSDTPSPLPNSSVISLPINSQLLQAWWLGALWLPLCLRDQAGVSAEVLNPALALGHGWGGAKASRTGAGRHVYLRGLCFASALGSEFFD